MKNKIIIGIMVVFLSCGGLAQAANITFTSDANIQAGDSWSNVSIYDSPPAHTTVNMTGGLVTDILRVYNASTFNMSAGQVRGGLSAYDQSTVNISSGSVIGSLGATNNSTVSFSGSASVHLASTSDSGIFNVYGGTIYQLTGLETSTVNVYGGTISGNAGLNANDLSVFNLMGGSVAKLMSGSSATINVFGSDLAKTNTGGLYGDGQVTGFWQDGLQFTIDLYGTYAYSRINLIPEPATFLLLGVGTFLLRKSRRRIQKSL